MKYTNGDIKRLGETIVKNNGIINDDELELLQNYRKSFTEPLSLTFNKLVAIKNNVGRDGIIAFRLKRIRTIVNKVLRNPSMQLNRMGDIAGIRIILENQNQVYKALKLIEAEFEISGKIRDYIANPKRIGYKGVHVYIKDKNFLSYTLSICFISL
jgi:ppGpp synthetase/RelA/SpoT-type nucleotidyltranferase